jgi:hypothetical protein
MLSSLHVPRALKKGRFEVLKLVDIIIYMQLLRVYRDIDLTDAKASIWLLMLNGFPVTLSALLFEDELHCPFCMLDDGGLNLDLGLW